MFPLIEVSGPARERGRQHGLQAQARIERSIVTYARLFAYCGFDWQLAQRLGAAYRDVIGDLDPALLAEIEGIASGAGRQAAGRRKFSRSSPWPTRASRIRGTDPNRVDVDEQGLYAEANLMAITLNNIKLWDIAHPTSHNRHGQ